jgi:hypothetical protein
MNINEYKKMHIDSEAPILVDLLEVLEIKPNPKLKEKKDEGASRIFDPSIVLANVTDIIETNGLGFGQVIGKTIIQMSNKNAGRFQKLVTTIHQDKNLNKIVSRDFIESTTRRWLLACKVHGERGQPFSEYLSTEITEALDTAKYHFPIVHLTIYKPFKIGNVEIGNFTNEYFETYIKLYREINSDEPKVYEYMRKNFYGRAYAAVSVSSTERIKAKELALEMCSLSVDILKICSVALEYPSVVMPFDIDMLSPHNDSEMIIEYSDINKGLSTSFKNPFRPFAITDRVYEFMKKRQVEVFHNFLLTIGDDPSELQRLIVKGIRRFAKALSNTNHHQRIAELISILDSLLLSDSKSPIMETVSKYLSKLITKDLTERKAVIKLVKEMYDVRSAWVHHAKEQEFSIEGLTELQRNVQQILIVLIDKANTHTEKKTILSEIDDAILGAY